ncbi:hypothetical protein TNCV_2914431 [Trichonephila clavipes]|nr:hypothetical protein TNCV_2914431 [Trichonephila clavipes]
MIYPNFQKETRDETVMPSTSGYNLRPRRGAKVESRPANEKRTGSIQRKQGETTVQTLYRGAKKVKQQEYQKQTTALPGEERRSEQQQIPLPGGPSMRRQLQVIKIRLSRELKEEKKAAVLSVKLSVTERSSQGRSNSTRDNLKTLRIREDCD